MTYIPGDYWVIDPKTGFKIRSSELVQEPLKDNIDSGNWVWKAVVDPVHPQEYVVGVEDDPSVLIAFPDNAQVVGEVALIARIFSDTKKPFPIGATVSEGDPVGIVMDNGAAFWSFADSVESLPWRPWVDGDGDMLYDVDGNLLTTADAFNGTMVTLGSYIHYGASV